MHYIIYVEKTPKNEEKPKHHENVCKDNDKNQIYHQNRKYNSNKHKENNVIYEPKILVDKKDHQQNQQNNVFQIEEKTQKLEQKVLLTEETNVENERKILPSQPIIEASKSENLRTEKEEKTSFSESVQIIESKKKNGKILIYLRNRPRAENFIEKIFKHH